MLGDTLGLILGPKDGPMLGDTLGLILGPKEGDTLGPNDGLTDGDTLGPMLGDTLGLAVYKLQSLESWLSDKSRQVEQAESLAWYIQQYKKRTHDCSAPVFVSPHACEPAPPHGIKMVGDAVGISVVGEKLG